MERFGTFNPKLILAAFCAAFLFSCNEPVKTDDVKTEGVTEEKTEAPKVQAPEFNADTALLFVKKQVDFGPRVPGTKAHAKCAEYLVKTLKSYGLSTNVQEGSVRTFDSKIYTLKNIIASLNPEKDNRIMLTAHWDTRPFADQDEKDQDKPIDGANDGGSGVGVLLEMARQFALKNPGVGVDIIFWDIEDYGQPANSKFPEMENSYCIGSQYWAKYRTVTRNYRFGINLDMVGGSKATFTQEGNSVYYAPGVLEKVWRTAADIGYGSYFISERTSPITDDHAYVNELARIPCIDIIENDRNTRSNFYKHWHTHNDTYENIDKTTLKAVGQTLMQVVYNEK